MTIELLTTAEVAQAFRVTPVTLRVARLKGSQDYPPHIRIGGRVLYRREAVEAFLAARETHQAKPAGAKRRGKR